MKPANQIFTSFGERLLLMLVSFYLFYTKVIKIINWYVTYKGLLFTYITRICCIEQKNRLKNITF